MLSVVTKCFCVEKNVFFHLNVLIGFCELVKCFAHLNITRAFWGFKCENHIYVVYAIFQQSRSPRLHGSSWDRWLWCAQPPCNVGIWLSWPIQHSEPFLQVFWACPCSYLSHTSEPAEHSWLSQHVWSPWPTSSLCWVNHLWLHPRVVCLIQL